MSVSHSVCICMRVCAGMHLSFVIVVDIAAQVSVEWLTLFFCWCVNNTADVSNYQASNYHAAARLAVLTTTALPWCRCDTSCSWSWSHASRCCRLKCRQLVLPFVASWRTKLPWKTLAWPATAVNTSMRSGCASNSWWTCGQRAVM